MQRIKAEAGPAIDQVCSQSSIPPAFIAGLIANETGEQFAEGGIAKACNAKRFEKGVLGAIWEVLLGRKTAYGSIGRSDLVAFVVGLPAPPVTAPRGLPTDALQRIDGLATSWGLTQVMGYHTIEPSSGLETPNDLILAGRCLAETIRLLAEFAHRFQLDLAKDFKDLFDCWNSGDPVAGPRHTFDPQYVAKGIARMELYLA